MLHFIHSRIMLLYEFLPIHTLQYLPHMHIHFLNKHSLGWLWWNFLFQCYLKHEAACHWLVVIAPLQAPSPALITPRPCFLDLPDQMFPTKLQLMYLIIPEIQFLFFCLIFNCFPNLFCKKTQLLMRFIYFRDAIHFFVWDYQCSCSWW